MKLTKLLIILSSLLILLNSCSSFKEAGKVLRNDKTKTLDEFLVKTKEPLTQPPDFNTIPEPGSIKKKSISDQDNIKKLLRSGQPVSKSKQSRASSTEESILQQIKK